MACMDFRSLSLKSASRYWLAAARCGWRLKHPANSSANVPNRCKSARADDSLTADIVPNARHQYKYQVSNTFGAITRT